MNPNAAAIDPNTLSGIDPTALALAQAVAKPKQAVIYEAILNGQKAQGPNIGNLDQFGIMIGTLTSGIFNVIQSSPGLGPVLEAACSAHEANRDRYKVQRGMVEQAQAIQQSNIIALAQLIQGNQTNPPATSTEKI